MEIFFNHFIFIMTIDNINELIDKINFILSTFQISQNVPVNYIVPTEQKWNSESQTHYCLFYKGNTYAVTVSSINAGDPNNHSPDLLFNGKKENEGGKRWATESNLTEASIQIDFDERHPQVANILKMTARDGGCYKEAPISFEIFGISKQDEVEIIKSLRKFENVSWSPNETKIFGFYNPKHFTGYKIVFYSSSCPFFGLAELNIGYTIYNEIQNMLVPY